jgi:membrane-bound lytic murein transglycosylase D
MGENGVARALERNRARGLRTDYESLPMPNETRRYVPSLVALKNIIANPPAFGVELDPVPNAPYFVTVTLTRDIDLKVAAKLAEMPLEEFVALNPGHNRPVVSTSVAPQIVLPADRVDVFVRNLDSHAKPLSSWQVYTFKAGDRLDRIAAERGVTVERLRAANGIGPKSRVRVGQQLLVPEKGSAAAKDPLPPNLGAAVALNSRVVEYTVRKGDTLSKIARAVGAKLAEVRSANDDEDHLSVGETLTISIVSDPPRRKARITRSTKSAGKKPATRATVKTAPARPAPPAQVARPSSSS